MKRAICLLALAPALLYAGCGGGDDDSPPTTIPAATTQTPQKLSKEQFISQGDGFCGEVNAALDALSGDSAGDQAASLYKGLLEHLRGLGTPDDDAGLDDFLSAGDDLVNAEEGRGDVATAQSAFSSAASSYGFQVCGQGSAPASSGTGTTGVTPAPATTAPVVPAPTTTVPAAPVIPAPTPGATGAGGGTAGSGGGGTSGGSGGVGPG